MNDGFVAQMHGDYVIWFSLAWGWLACSAVRFFNWDRVVYGISTETFAFWFVALTFQCLA
jgi:hypothetical protein